MENVKNSKEDIENILRIRTHQPAGPIYINLRKRHAAMCLKDNEELRAIYSLSESHAPTYRIKTEYRYNKILTSTENKLTMNKDHISFECPQSFDSEIESMLKKVADLPKEWTIVQITTQFNIKDSMQQDLSKMYTNPLHITVFNCGQTSVKPFCINVSAPKDLDGKPIELCQEMHSILSENKNLLTNCFGSIATVDQVTTKQKKVYSDYRSALNNRLKDVIKQMEKKWLREWRCLLIGKFFDECTEQLILEKLSSVVKNDKSGYNLTEKVQYLLQRIIAASEYLSTSELLKAICYCIPDHKELRTKIYNMILEASNDFQFKTMIRHPVILIIDENLDCFPWEMIDVLADHPVSRIPSLHFAYALYKEHEQTIIDGHKQVSSTLGNYIVNPGLDLKKMEMRLKQFFEFWIPQWKGLVGQTPSSEEFSELLTSSDIFVYNGHGSGTQFLAANKIQNMRVNSVVLLFGCSSVRMNSMGPFVEMYDVFHNYIIACSPCVVGMLWEVTDFDTDLLSTGILSQWIASKANFHWKFVDTVKWNKGIIARLAKNAIPKPNTLEPDHEPELLRAINIARKAPIQYITKCAIVARGLPIKIIP